jgi:hypothetical protein
MAKRPTLRPASSSKQQPPRFPYSRDLALCILPLLVGIGIAMIPLNFWVGVSISTIAAILFVIVLIVLIRSKAIMYVSIAVAIALYCVVIWAIYVPASVRVTLDEKPGNYTANADIFGIKWRENYYEADIILTNRSNADMLNLDLEVTTDLLIAGVGFGPGINNCSSGAVTANMFLAV